MIDMPNIDRLKLDTDALAQLLANPQPGLWTWQAGVAVLRERIAPTPKPRHEPQGESYLGDGVYASHDGYQVWLRVEPQEGHSEMVALEPAVFAALLRYAKEKGIAP